MSTHFVSEVPITHMARLKRLALVVAALGVLALALWSARSVRAVAPTAVCQIPATNADLAAAIADNNCPEIEIAAGTIHVTNSMVINRPVVIRGAGQTATLLDGQGSVRLFDINDGDNNTAVAVTLSDLTIQNGYVAALGGGGLISVEALTLERVTVRDNSSGGVGGGIYSFNADLQLGGATIIGNTPDNIYED